MRKNVLAQIKIGGALTSAILLGACAVGPDFVKPEHPVNAQYTEGSSGEFDSTEALTTWWSSFHDDDLNQLVDAAVRNNKSLSGALARVNQARALRQETQYDLLPTVTTDTNFTQNQISTVEFPPGSGIKRRHDIFQAGADAFWEIDLFGRVRREVEESKAAENASIADLHNMLQTVLSDVATNYFELRGFQASLAVAEKNAKSEAETVKVTQAQAASGLISDFDTARASAQYQNTVATIAPFEASIRVAIHQLSVLCGQNPDALEAQLLVPKPLPMYAGPVSISDPASMLRRRPDVKAAEERLHSQVAGIGVAEGDYFPKVTFVGSVGFEATTPRHFGDSGSGVYSFGPDISWAAFDMGRVIARVHAAKASEQEALANYEQAVLVSLQEVENALVHFSSERKRRDNLQEAAVQSTKAARIANDRYRAGGSDFLTVLDAERVQFQAEGDLSQSQTQLAVNLVSLYKALGGGWESYTLGKRGY